MHIKKGMVFKMTKDIKKAPAKKKLSKAAAAKKRRNRKILFAAEAVVIILLVCVLWVMNKFDKMDKSVQVKEENIDVNEGIETLEAMEEGYLNVALFGVDSRDSGSFGKGTHSDTIIVASINNKTGDVKLVSVYRDSYLNIGDDTYRKATQAYFNGGPEQAIGMLNMNLDLNIKRYVAVDFTAITKVVDLLGGIEIDVQADEIEHLNNYTVETSEVTGVSTSKLTQTGPQILDGVQATSYARIRYTDGNDFKRTERQRTVIMKIVEKAKKANLSTLNNIINEVFPSVSTNFTITDILAVATDAAKYNIADTTGFPFDKTTMVLNNTVGDIVVPVSLDDNVTQLHKLLFDEENYTPSATVQAISKKVANDTGVSQ